MGQPLLFWFVTVPAPFRRAGGAAGPSGNAALTNLAALFDAALQPGFAGAVTHVVSNRPHAAGLEIARQRGAVTSVVDRGAPGLVVLAGFMRVLTDAFVARYAGRLLNIHPSLLPAYPGLHTHRRALADGVKVHGCTVHFVTPAVDVGPIVAQAAVPVRDDDDEDSLATRVLAEEHRVLPAAVAWFCAGRIALHGERVRVQDPPIPQAALVVPLPAVDCPMELTVASFAPAPRRRWWDVRPALLVALALSSAGIAFGIDRIAALMAGTESIRDVIAFPETTTAQCLMTQAPSPLPDAQLAEVHVQVRPKVSSKE